MRDAVNALGLATTLALLATLLGGCGETTYVPVECAPSDDIAHVRERASHTCTLKLSDCLLGNHGELTDVECLSRYDACYQAVWVSP